MNMMFMDLIAVLVSFLLTVAFGKIVIPWLVKLKFGQSILEIGPNWHKNKQGTPTMGGIMFVLGIGVTVLLAGIPLMVFDGDFRHLLIFGFALVFGVIGFIDDYAKVSKQQNKGLSALQKLLLQLAASAVFLTVLRISGDLTPNLVLPFVGEIELPWLLYLFLMLFVIVGAVNAVNLTDGVDGLATSVTLPVALLFGVLAFAMSLSAAGLFAAALFGALFGFLVYNRNPAKVFMGDTGSLFLGGAIVGLAFAFDLPLILLFAGIVYIAETLSVILQVGYFKLTHGKRLFKMSPIHHHFELCGWSENKLCVIFTLVSALGCLIGYFGVI